MSKHLFATIVTPTAAANNRGEGDGSTSTLQKITAVTPVTTVSAEAIRWGLREYFQSEKDESHL